MTVQPIDPAREDDDAMADRAHDRAKSRDEFLARLRSDPAHAEAMRRLADR
ncbi:hypothetical protein ACFV6F_14565 [Kitasatospora phosalacinea]|uniref:hypothetical protein n=1 Tax=Kitasatospora phosalacinea TaxID=2065 RepID=UPI00364EB2CA